MFEALGDAVRLDGRMQVFRGIDVTGTPTDYSPDVAGIGAHLTSQAQLHSNFVDLGIGCATTAPDIAMCCSDEDRTIDDRHRVLMQLDVHSALCLPRMQHQSPALLEHLAGVKHVYTDIPHLVFPRGTAWEITSIEAQSAHEIPLVHMRQQ